MKPLIIEVALNGETSKARNPNVPRSPAEIGADGIACMEGGAALLHNHTDDPWLSGEAAADRYGEGWAAILARRPEAILCPSMTGGSSHADRFAHFAPCAQAGAKMAPLDPGSMNMPLSGGGVGTAQMLNYVNSYDDIGLALDTMSSAGLAASMGIYEPGFLRAAIAFHKAGKLPPGSLAKLYFFGGFNYYDATPCIGFGLGPSPAALDAYLGIIADSGLSWAVAVVGGCVFRTGMAKLAIQRGGHIRLGLEDHAGERTPTNLELLEEVVGLARSLGREIATPSQAAELLGLP
jgi:3-keto-5-aminohexanoate cleavage enzyme